MLKFIAFIIELMNGLHIMLSPFLAGLILGVLAVIGIEGVWGEVIGISLFCTGLILGIYWAAVVAKRKGTTNFMSKVNASPDLDKQDNEL
ncbi:hypothetical protein G5B10_06970 [Fluviicola sp. SGL-29]|nr:hypothetical protein [Fluviicola sp. SGL-29]